MAATTPLLSSLVSGLHRLIRSFLKPIHPHSCTPLIRISCSPPHNLGSTQRYPIIVSFGSRSPSPLHAHRKFTTLIKSMEPQETLIKYQNLWETQRGPLDKKKLLNAWQPPPAMVTCTIVEEDCENTTVVHLSTFDSNGALLNQFSKPIAIHKAKVLSACQNLLLLAGVQGFVCNIATQEAVGVPDIGTGVGSSWVTGFGYLPSTKKFKLLADVRDFDLGFRVLTLGNKRWRRVTDYFLPMQIPTDQIGGGAFVNGAFHFFAWQGNQIVTFNLESEKWGTLRGPPINPDSSRSLHELSDHLCFVSNSHFGIDIWLLDHFKSWVRLCTINSAVLDDKSIYRVQPLAIEKDGRILLHVTLLNMFSLQFYDSHTRSTREIHRFSPPTNCRDFYIKVFSSLGHREKLSISSCVGCKV